MGLFWKKEHVPWIAVDRTHNFPTQPKNIKEKRAYKFTLINKKDTINNLRLNICNLKTLEWQMLYILSIKSYVVMYTLNTF